MFTIECPGDIAFNQAIYDLHFFNNLAILHNLQAGPFDYQIVLVLIEKILGSYLRNEFGIGIFLGILGVQAVFILNKQNSARTDQVGKDN